MKAIKKSDGEEVEVRLLHPCEYLAIEPDAEGYAVFRADDLIIDEPVDWSSFRREAAKEILAGMLSAPALISIGGKRLGTLPDFAKAAVKLADELIKRLRDGQVHQTTKE